MFAPSSLPTQKKTRISIGGGILTIIAGCLSLAFGLYGIIIAMFWPSSPIIEEYAIGVSGIFGFVLGLVGGICALKRSHFALSLVGPCSTLVSGVVEIGLFTKMSIPNLGVLHSLRLVLQSPLGFLVLLSILGLIFTSIAREEFS